MTEPDHADFWDNSPSGHLILTAEGRIVAANATFVTWIGHPAEYLRDRFFAELLTVGGRIHYETHFAPILRMSRAIPVYRRFDQGLSLIHI